MTALDYQALLPYLTLAGVLILLLLVISFKRGHALAAVITVAGLAISIAVVAPSLSALPRTVTPLIRLDDYAAYLFTLFAAAAIVTALLSYRYLRGRRGELEEYYVLLLGATLGAATLATAVHFGAVLLGLEILSICLYTLIGYPEEHHAPLEAALKYLVLSGVASTTMLFGMALIYIATGGLDFATIGKAGSDEAQSQYLLVGNGLFLIGIAFKISLVPFHMWTPDVYHGAPAPVSGYLATVSKGAVVAVALRYVDATGSLADGPLLTLFGAVAVLSMVIGNLLALMQRNVKRILAYSSIAHFGYLLIALIVVGSAGGVAMGIEASIVYLTAYVVMTLTAFGVITISSRPELGREADDIDDYAGLFWSRPGLALGFTVALLSLAGIPLTLGFIAKFYLFATGTAGELWVLLWALVLGSGIGLFYYLRVIFAMTRSPDVPEPVRNRVGARADEGTVAVLVVLLIAFGVYPTPLIDVVREAVAAFGG